MPKFEKRTIIKVSPQEAYDWHARPGAFLRLSPPWERMKLIQADQGLHAGAETIFAVRKAGQWVRWVARHSHCEPGRSFTDEQAEGPFSKWKHVHEFSDAEDGHVALHDTVDWKLPGGPLAMVAHGFARKQLQRMFAFRHRRTQNDLLRHAAYADRPRLRIAISGVTGLVGRNLEAFLTTGGHTVVRIVRRRPRPGDCLWDPANGTIDASALEGLDGVVHLAGAPVSEPWTPEHKRAILESRVKGTRLLAETLARLSKRPEVFVSGSAIGWYGNRYDEVLTEGSLPGEDFLASVAKEWEAQTAPAADTGIRVVHLRTGIVLTPRGGALAKMLPPFRAGAGGPIGGGDQWVSWISLDDLIGAIHFSLYEATVTGPVNGTSPNPVRQRELARILGRTLCRPALVPLPAFALRRTMREMGEALVLAGQRVLPYRLEARGFSHLDPDLETTLRHQLT